MEGWTANHLTFLLESGPGVVPWPLKTPEGQPNHTASRKALTMPHRPSAYLPADLPTPTPTPAHQTYGSTPPRTPRPPVYGGDWPHYRPELVELVELLEVDEMRELRELLGEMLAGQDDGEKAWL